LASNRHGAPHLTATNWTIIGWLVVFNTAFAFALWNHTLRTIPVLQSGITNSTVLIHVAILAWLFLGKVPTTQYRTWD
jgi:drug/metabolite transporter (DMT)-like permease